MRPAGAGLIVLAALAAASAAALRRQVRVAARPASPSAGAELAAFLGASPVVLQRGPDRLVVLHGEPGPVPPGWEPTASPQVWARSRSPRADLATLLPAAVTVGRLGTDDVVVDAEATGVLSVLGVGATAVLGALWAELRWPAEAGDVEVLAIGLEDLEGSVGRTGWTDALDRLEARQAHVDAVLGPDRSRLDAARHGAAVPPPVIVLADQVPEPASRRRLGHLARRPAPGGAVLAIGALGGWALWADGARRRLEPLGLALDAVEPAARAADAGVEVRVLGPVEIRGVVLGPKAAELVTYLALHPGGVTEMQLRTALWPERVVPRKTFNNLVSVARMRLGRDGRGRWHLPHAVGGRYALGSEISCDLVTLEGALEAACRTPSAEQDRALRDALAAVRGQPFAGWEGASWPYEESVVARADALVARAADHLARRARVGDDAEAARWAADRGLRAVPDARLEEHLHASTAPGSGSARPC